MSLYKITEDILHLLDSMDEYINPDTGEIKPEFDAQLNTLSGGFDKAADNLAAYIKGLKAEAEMIKAEAGEMYDKASARTARAKKLTDFLGMEMKALGKDKLKTDRFSIYFQKNPDRVEVEMPVQLPPEYQRVTIEAKIDLLKQALKDKSITLEELAGAGVSIVQGTEGVRIK